MSELLIHLQTNEDNRDQNWDEKFFKLMTDANLQILADDPHQGPGRRAC